MGTVLGARPPVVVLVQHVSTSIGLLYLTLEGFRVILKAGLLLLQLAETQLLSYSLVEQGICDTVLAISLQLLSIL